MSLRGARRVSVVIRSLDEAASIGETLRRLNEQSLGGDGTQIIVVDSGSRDETREIARAAGARVVCEASRPFSYGRALNHGCELAEAPIIVALSAHAFPPDREWLARMLAPFEDERVACACGDRFGPDGRPLRTRFVQDAAQAGRQPFWGYSNAAGAFRTELWRRRRFREDMPGTEDVEWARWWLERGWVTIIDPELVVEHDHSHDPLRDIYVRARREWAGFAMFTDPGPGSLGRLVHEWWTDRGHHRSHLRARLSRRRAARLLGKYTALRAARSHR